MLDGGFANLLLTARPALQRFLIARGASSGDVEDILQDLFLKTGQISGPIAEPKAYLYRMADNLLLDRRRSAARRIQRERNWANMQASSTPGMDETPSPEHALIARERVAAVKATLEALPVRTATAFRLYRLEDRSQQQVADEMGISLSAVEKHLQRAYRAVRECRARLDAENPDPRRRKDEGGKQVADDG